MKYKCTTIYSMIVSDAVLGVTFSIAIGEDACAMYCKLCCCFLLLVTQFPRQPHRQRKRPHQVRGLRKMKDICIFARLSSFRLLWGSTRIYICTEQYILYGPMVLLLPTHGLNCFFLLTVKYEYSASVDCVLAAIGSRCKHCN